MTTGKPIVLTILIFVSKMVSLLFNILSRFVVSFLLRRKRLNFMAVVTVDSDLEPNKIKSVIVSIFLITMT